MRKLTLIQTCDACPEQYDAYIGDRKVGYLRMRHGHFSVECPDAGGELVFEAKDLAGDGSFSDKERPEMLDKASSAILKWVENKERKTLANIGRVVTWDNAERVKICETVEVIANIGEIILTPEERRELVMKATRAFIEKFGDDVIDPDAALDPFLWEKIFVEQGL